jgi:hypothetical protein
MELEQFLLGWFGSSSLLALIELVLASDIMEFGYNRAPYVHYPCAIVAWAALLIFFFGHVKATIASTKILGDESYWIVSQNIVERRTRRDILNPLNQLAVRGFIWRWKQEGTYLKQVFNFNFFRM